MCVCVCAYVLPCPMAPCYCCASEHNRGQLCSKGSRKHHARLIGEKGGGGKRRGATITIGTSLSTQPRHAALLRYGAQPRWSLA